MCPLLIEVSDGLILTEHSPDCGVHTTVIELFIVQLCEEREQDLDAPYRVYGTVDGVGDDGLYILWATLVSADRNIKQNTRPSCFFFTALLSPKFGLVIFHCQ